MSEAVFHAPDTAQDAIEEVEAIVSQVAPEAETAIVEPTVAAGEAVFQDVSQIVENGTNVAADVAPALDGVKNVEDLVREIHADINAVRAFVERISGELEKVGPLGLITALMKGSL